MSEYGHLFGDTNLNSTEKIKGKSIKTSIKKKAVLADRYSELKEVMPDMGKDECLHLISSDNFGSIELLKYMIEKYDPEHISMTTWSINQDYIELIKDCNIDMCLLIDQSLKTRKFHLYAQVAELAIDGKIDLKVHYKLHAKVSTFRTKDMFFSIESSANYSQNARIENFVITESKEIYDFHNSWMNQIVGK
jgi:hypothetical protein